MEDLQSNVDKAVARRRELTRQCDAVRAEGETLSGQTRSFDASSQATLSTQFSLTSRLSADAQAAAQDLTVHAAEMMTARDAARSAVHHPSAALTTLAAQLGALRQKKHLQRVWGYVLLFGLGGILLLSHAYLSMLVVILGTIILLKLGHDNAAILHLEQALAGEQQNDQASRQAVQQQLAAAQQQLAAARDKAMTAVKQLQLAAKVFYDKALESSARTWRQEWEALPAFLRGDWSDEAWLQHDFSQSARLPVVVAALATETPGYSNTPFIYPLFAPFLGQQKTLVLAGRVEQTLSLMHGLVLQLATALPYQATFLLLDPAGAGRAFPMQRSLPFNRRASADFFRELETVLEDITRLIHTYLDGQTTSFEQLPEQIQANERFEFIFAANFPDGYDRRTIEALQKIAKNGPAAGKYLIIQQLADKELPRDLRWEDFGALWRYDLQKPPFANMSGYKVAAYPGPKGSEAAQVLGRLAAAKPPETKVDWRDLISGDPETWWREEASEIVSAPVGASGRERKLTIWFGANRDGRPCAHGILGAMTGSGKSNLYHVLICGLAVRYPPSELNLYLVDGKFGVEFQPYRSLPHARVVALHSAPELSRSVLEELLAEMKRRNEIFKRQGVSDLPGYRAKGSPEGNLARTVLMIDEYQELFDDDRTGQASLALMQLAQQGRSSGIHMLLGSQRFGAAGMEHQAAIFGNVHLRMAMKMSQNDVQGLTEFGRDGKRLVEQCDLPGKIVINDQSGEDRSNEFGKVALLDGAARGALLAQIAAKATAEPVDKERFATVVFDGQEQPNFVENPQVAQLLQWPRRPSAEDWRAFAIRPVHAQGIGTDDWYAGERPLALWLGQELNVHGQARLILRRRTMENVLVVGEHQPAIYGMLMGMLASLPLNAPASGLRVWVVDRAVPGTPWEHALDAVSVPLLDGAGYQVSRTRDVRQAMAWLDEWQGELDRRLVLDEAAVAAEPTWLLLLAGADRLPALTRAAGKYGAPVETPEGEKLKRIYRDGPGLGLHVVVTFPAGGSLRQVLDRPQIDQFKHRLLTQVAEADSFLLLGKDHAAKLQRAEARPIFALYLDMIGGGEVKFKPYTADAQIPWDEQTRWLADNLQRWREE